MVENQKIKKIKLGETTYDIQTTENNVVLESDLYAYTNVGKITGATNTSPKKVASAGDTLKTVFTNVFGTQTDQDPSMTAATYSLSKSQDTVTAGGGEYGATVTATTATVTFTLSTAGGTAPYGYKYKNAQSEELTSKGSKSFYYPISKQSNGDIKITLPAGKTATVIEGYGDLVSSEKAPGSTTENILYCDFNSDKQVKLQISLESDTVELTEQMRYDSISAVVKFGKAQVENQLTAGSEITSFLTYFGKDATSPTVTAYLSKANATASSSAYKITAGYVPYTFQLATATPLSLPTANRTQNKPTSITVSGGSSSTYLYIFVPSSKADISAITSSGFGVPFTKVESSKSYAVNNSKSTTYKVFKTDSAVIANTFSIT